MESLYEKRGLLQVGLNDQKNPMIRIDNSLEKYKSMPIFQDKVNEANEVLRKVGLPKVTSK